MDGDLHPRAFGDANIYDALRDDDGNAVLSGDADAVLRGLASERRRREAGVTGQQRALSPCCSRHRSFAADGISEPLAP